MEGRCGLTDSTGLCVELVRARGDVLDRDRVLPSRKDGVVIDARLATLDRQELEGDLPDHLVLGGLTNDDS